MLNQNDFQFICQLIRSESGIELDTGKEYLVDLRLSELSHTEGYRSAKTMVQNLMQTPNSSLRRKIVDALTTNETSFFRDFKPFEYLRKEVIPHLTQRPDKTINIWSAACSTGQEPYSIAMILQQFFPHLLEEFQVNILATDISFNCLEFAQKALYSQFQVNRGLPAAYLVRYFEQQGQEWQLKSSIRNLVNFREFNLIGPWQGLATMDIIFMSNVMMYFSTETKRMLFERIRSQLKPDGYLFLGGSENPFGLNAHFTRVDSVDNANCYRLIKS